MGRDLVEHFCAMAPRTFMLHSRNPEKAVRMGGRAVNFFTANGAPHASDRLPGRRYGDHASLCEIIRINSAPGAVHISGGEEVEPTDVPVALRPVPMAFAHIAHGDLVRAARGIGRQPVPDAARMACLPRGIAEEELAERPSFCVVTNSSSPRRLDEELPEGAMAAAELGQAVCATPFTLAGAMAPITLAGALALQTAEAMAVIALAQMVRPGSPAICGGFTPNLDMRSGSPAFGTYEKIVVDTGMVRGWAEAMRPIEAGTDDLAVEAVLEVPPGGHFSGSPHRMTRFETAFHAPLVSDRTGFETWQERGAKETAERATEVWQRALRDCVPPPLGPAVDEALRDFVARRTREEAGGAAT